MHRQPFQIEIGLALQLHDVGGDQGGVALFFGGVLQEFLRDRVGVDAAGHEVMPFVAQDAHQLGGQRFVQQLHHSGAVGLIG